MGGVGNSSATLSQPIPFIKCPTCGTYVQQIDEHWKAEYQFQILENNRRFQENIARLQYLNNEQQILNSRLQNEKRHKMGDTEEILQNEKYFTYNEYCRKHRSYQCLECIDTVRRIMRTKTDNQNLPAIIANPSDFQDVDGESVKKNFEDQVIFVQKSLGLSDKEVEKIKIKELPTKMREAQEKVTVGTMRNLMNERIHVKGVLEKIGGFFAKKF